ncbi:MAG: TOBE domain-containing protein [Paludibacter sp.]|nr:TOBE domain-containing protein [Paludibacter sp.]
MNCLSGHIETLSGAGNITIAGIKTGQTLIYAIVIGDARNKGYLTPETKVEALFNESEVMIGKSVSGKLSIGNAIECLVTSVDTGKVFTNIGLNIEGNIVFSMIASTMFHDMGIAVGDKVTAYIKMTDVFIQYPENEKND